MTNHMCLPFNGGFPKIGDPKRSTINSRILIIRTLTNTLIFGKSQMELRSKDSGFKGIGLEVAAFRSSDRV